MIGGNPPSVYLDRIQRKFGTAPERMDELLASHLIDPKAARADDFASFLKAREQAIGKPVIRDLVPGKPAESAKEQAELGDMGMPIEEAEGAWSRPALRFRAVMDGHLPPAGFIMPSRQ